MADLRPVTCCFSGYRIEKMPFRNEDCPAARELFAALDAAVAEAAVSYTHLTLPTNREV